MQAGSSRSRERDWQTDREMTNEKKKEGRKNNSITEYVLELLQQLHRGTKGVLMAHQPEMGSHHGHFASDAKMVALVHKEPLGAHHHF
jgi:hypothetical protein